MTPDELVSAIHAAFPNYEIVHIDPEYVTFTVDKHVYSVYTNNLVLEDGEETHGAYLVYLLLNLQDTIIVDQFMNYCEKYAKRFRVGDLVIIVRKADSYENGWDNVWNSSMDEFVGRIGHIGRINSTGICVEDISDRYPFPPFVLEHYAKPPFKKGDRIKYRNVCEQIEGIVSRVVGNDVAFDVNGDEWIAPAHYCTLQNKKKWRIGCKNFTVEGDYLVSSGYAVPFSLIKKIYEDIDTSYNVETGDNPALQKLVEEKARALQMKNPIITKNCTLNSPILGDIKNLKKLPAHEFLDIGNYSFADHKIKWTEKGLLIDDEIVKTETVKEIYNEFKGQQ